MTRCPASLPQPGTNTQMKRRFLVSLVFSNLLSWAQSGGSPSPSSGHAPRSPSPSHRPPSTSCPALKNSDYKTVEYWEARYVSSNSSSHHDWFRSYRDSHQLREALERGIGPVSSSPRILVVGCGNSLLSQDLYEAGYSHIESVDFSPQCISLMREQNKARPTMRWSCMDVRHMDQLSASSFDVVVDKGTMDALMVRPPLPQ